MPVQLRVDDYPYTKPEEAWRHTPQAFAAFDECIPAKYLLGVIPGKLDLFPSHSILSTGKIVVGMHGVHHDEDFLNENGSNEFARVPFGQHGFVLKNGLIKLWRHASVKSEVYMPPRNTIDQLTANACNALGFKAVTTGPETDLTVTELIWFLGMRPLQSLPPFSYGRSDELLQRGAVEHLYESHDRGETVVLGLHWTWETNIGLGTLRTLVKELGPILEGFHV